MDDLRTLLGQLEAPAPSAAGGTAAALAAAAAASLVIMVARGSPSWPDGPHTAAAAEQLRERLLTLGNDDAAAIKVMLDALRTPNRPDRQAALLTAARVPCEIAQQAAEVAKLAQRAAHNGKRVMAADASIALILADAATRAAALIVTTNTKHFHDDIDPAEANTLREVANKAEQSAANAALTDESRATR